MNKNKKYIIFGDASYPHIYKWYQQLKDDYDVYVVTFGKKKFIKYKYEKLYSLELNMSSSGGNKQVLKSLVKVYKIFKEIKPSIVNAHYLTSYGFIAALISKVLKFYLVQSTWGTDILVTPNKNKTFKLLAKFSLNSADLISSDSLSMTKVIKKLSNKEVITFPMGIEKSLLTNTYDKYEDFTFLSLRTLNENSNIDMIINAFYKFHKVNKNAKLIIAHKGHKERVLKDLVKSLDLNNNVSFVGFLNNEELVYNMKKSHVYLSLLTSDALSVSLLETIACGCIPFVSNVEGNLEVIKNNENGFIIDNENELYSIMNKVYKSYDIIVKDINKINKEYIKKNALIDNNFNFYKKSLNE